MYREAYVEHHVCRMLQWSDYLLRGVTIGTAIFFILLYLLNGTLIFVIPAAVAAGLAWWVWLHSQKDFDYFLTDEALRVDVVYAKSRRKTLVSLDLERQVVVIAAAGTQELASYAERRMPTMDCTSKDPLTQEYWLIYRDGEQERKLIFEPSAPMLEQAARVLPGRVWSRTGRLKG